MKTSYLLHSFTSAFHQKDDHPVVIHLSVWHTANSAGEWSCSLWLVFGGGKSSPHGEKSEAGKAM